MGSLREICVFSIRRGGIFLTGPSSRPSCVPSSVGCASPCILKALLATGQSVTLHDLSHSLHTHTFCLDILVNQKQMVSVEEQKLVSPSPSQVNGFGGVVLHTWLCMHSYLPNFPQFPSLLSLSTTSTTPWYRLAWWWLHGGDLHHSPQPQLHSNDSPWVGRYLLYIYVYIYN